MSLDFGRSFCQDVLQIFQVFRKNTDFYLNYTEVVFVTTLRSHIASFNMSQRKV